MQHGMVIKRAARIWYSAEVASNRISPMLTDGDIYAVAIPRVLAVFGGEVRWSETSPGDRAIWRGRARDVGRASANEPSIWVNMYDTLAISPTNKIKGGHGGIQVGDAWRLFGTANIGDLSKTNLQVGGQMCGDESFTIHQMYADISRDLSITDRVIVTLVLGTNRVWTGHLRGLAIGVPIGRHVPSRQTFFVMVNAFALTEPLELVVHMEGEVVKPVY